MSILIGQTVPGLYTFQESTLSVNDGLKWKFTNI